MVKETVNLILDTQPIMDFIERVDQEAGTRDQQKKLKALLDSKLGVSIHQAEGRLQYIARPSERLLALGLPMKGEA